MTVEKVLDSEIEDAKKISIVDYLIKRGLSCEKHRGKHYFNSPFSYDKTPSLCVYSTNTFYDWSNGFGGDIIKLVMELDNKSFMEAVVSLNGGQFEPFEKKEIEIYSPSNIDISKFLKTTKDEDVLIDNYAFKRSIIRGYSRSVFIMKNKEQFIRRPSVGFVHVDENMEECGIKMRDICPIEGRRFSARGPQKFYILSNVNQFHNSKTTPLYIVESESSANSLFEYLSAIKVPCVVISFGSWSNVPDRLPEQFDGFDKRSVIIDYDGNEDLYNERIEKFDHLNAREIKLELPKTEDINSLFISGKIHKYKQLFL